MKFNLKRAVTFFKEEGCSREETRSILEKAGYASEELYSLLDAHFQSKWETGYEIVNYPNSERNPLIIGENYIEELQFIVEDDMEFNSSTGEITLLSKGWSQYHRHKLIK